MSRAIFVRIVIRAPLDRVWSLALDPAAHARWDGRFSSITPVEELDDGSTRFRYTLRSPLGLLTGDGTTIGEKRRADGTRTSALRFDRDDRRSPLGRGRGYWRFEPVGGDVTVFTTGYDYEPGWGAGPDRVVRPLVGWLTAWSFDRLRIWAETGEPPECWPLWSALRVSRRARPRAARCTRRPSDGSADVMARAPAVLADLRRP